jgi:hypothetical protein
MLEKEAEKKKAILDEMYGETEQQKAEMKEMFDSYVEHMKQKQQQPLRNVLAK